MGDALLSFMCSLAALLLLVSTDCVTGTVVFLPISLYFLLKLLPSAKIAVPDDFHVVIVGSGASGICMGWKLNIMGIKYTILEKSAELGGTWCDNQYPGVACDVQSHFYSFSFNLNPYWPKIWSQGPEILQYFRETASKFGIYPNVKFGQRVTEARWLKTNNRWEVRTSDGSVYVANILISGSGLLHVPKTAVFPGAENYKGETMHTALWNKGYNPQGKRIAVIGTGASAVQLVPSLASRGVENLTVYQRTACWAVPRKNAIFPEWKKTMFSMLPFTNRLFRWFIFFSNELLYWFVISGCRWIPKFLADKVHDEARKTVRSVVKDPQLAEKLIPSYRIGCKRVTPSDTYLQTFNKDCVHLVTDKIDRFTKAGILTVDGKERNFDTIVYATGFDLLKSAMAYRMYGLAGRELGEVVQDTPMGYYGITHPEMPNFFMLLGPGTGLAHNSVLFMIECQVTYVADALAQLVSLGGEALQLKPQVMTDYWDWTQEMMKGKAFADNSSCQGWYRNERGVNWTLWPLDLVSYWWKTRSCSLQDYNLIRS